MDRVTKLWAQHRLAEGQVMDVWPGVLRFAYVENTGAAFGLLQGRQDLLALITGLVLAALLVWLILRGRTLPTLPQAALWLLLGGGVGNLLDRVLYGYVIDFVEIRLFTFPVFNVADSVVCIAFALLAGWILFGKEARGDGG